MDAKDLQQTNSEYDAMLKRWQFWLAAYEGTQALIDYGAIEKHPREDDVTYRQRLNDVFGFNYCGSIVDLFSYYLNEKEPSRDLGALAEDKTWQKFNDDCNLDGDSFDDWLKQWQKHASIYGHVGVLVDAPANRESSDAYPYVCGYTPEAILDWRYERDPDTGRQRLTMLKLREEGDTYLVWTLETWERWKIEDGKAERINSDVNPLGEIPFVWLRNKRGRIRYMGVSDIKDIARIDVGIMRHVSQAQEIIKYNAFPMLATPKTDAGDEKEVGPRAVLEFDPEIPDSRPFWLPTEVQAPIQAIVQWIERAINEIYRISNTGGLNATETSTQAKSGVALRQEFQRLNTTLAAKASLLDEAELVIIYFWLLWQATTPEQAQTAYKQVSVNRPRDFAIEDVEAKLAVFQEARVIMGSASPTWKVEMLKQVSRDTTPDLSDEVQAKVDKEIETNAARVPDIGEGTV